MDKRGGHEGKLSWIHWLLGQLMCLLPTYKPEILLNKVLAELHAQISMFFDAECSREDYIFTLFA